MAVSREELRKKRLKAVGVVSNERQATADMYDRIIEYGDKVAEARDHAEHAHVEDLNSQIRDLKEDLEELQEFGQAAVNPTLGAGTAAPVKPTTPPATGSAALAALNAAQPKLDPKAWGDGDAYHGTHPPEDPPQGS